MEQYYLRQLQKEDAMRMLEWLHDEGVTKYLRLNGKEMSLDDVKNFIADAADETVDLHRAVASNEGLYCGTVSLKNIDTRVGEAEYAISLHPDAIGKGAARIATTDILDLAFGKLNLKRVYLNVIHENRRAIRFYERFGFSFWRSEPILIKGKPTILDWYEISRKDMTIYHERCEK